MPVYVRREISAYLCVLGASAVQVYEGAYRGKDLHTCDASRIAAFVFLTRLLESGSDIRMVQELLGNTDLRTTMIFPHVLNSGWGVSRTISESLRAPCVRCQVVEADFGGTWLGGRRAGLLGVFSSAPHVMRHSFRSRTHTVTGDPRDQALVGGDLAEPTVSWCGIAQLLYVAFRAF